MLGWLKALINWIRDLFESLGPETKRKVIDALVSLFEDLFRAYYRETTTSK